VFRQPRYGEWDPVIARVANRLQRRDYASAQAGGMSDA